MNASIELYKDDKVNNQKFVSYSLGCHTRNTQISIGKSLLPQETIYSERRTSQVAYEFYAPPS